MTHSKRVFGLANDQKFHISESDIVGAIEMMKEDLRKASLKLY